MVVPRQSYLKCIDPDGTRPFADVKAEVSKMTNIYHSLIIAEKTSARHRAEIERGVVSAMEVYESFHLIRRQTNWGISELGCAHREHSMCTLCTLCTLCTPCAHRPSDSPRPKLRF